jgi:hypothetical protein
LNGLRASLAIIRRSLDRRFCASWLLAFSVVFVLAVLLAARIPRAAWFAALIVAQAPMAAFGRQCGPNRVSFFAMPLYGRQLARAIAVAPILAALAAPLAVVAGVALGGRPLEPVAAASILAAAAAATLVALSARLRTGSNAALYVVLAMATEAGLVVPLFFAHAESFALPLIVAAFIAYVALRAFGETLARYDPLPN